MAFERRLHPASFLFALGGHAKQLLVPGAVVLVTARSGSEYWETWAMVFIVPFAVAAAVRVLSYRYRFDAAELVVRTGFVFRNERHIPYARIQNVDAVQNVLHRVLGVAVVRIETGGASEGEAEMRVVSLDAFREVRDRVFEGRSPAAAGPAAPATTAGSVLRLPLREVILCGLIEGRGLVVLGGLFGLLWETGLIDNLIGGLVGEPTAGRGAVRQMLRAIAGQGVPSPGQMGLTLAAFGSFLVIVRLFSAGWAVVTLHGFTLTRTGDDLRLEYGLFTRVTATIPIRRIQALTIQEGPLHRLCGRVAIRVDTAGGEGEGAVQSHRHRLAPLLRRGELPDFLRAVLPDQDVEDVTWNPVDPRGVRRELTKSAIVATLAAVVLAVPLRGWAAPVVVLFLAWSVVRARKYVRGLGWATTDRAVHFRSGWLWRSTTVVPLGKIQVVAVHESPFDRRLTMAGVLVDTAGAGGESHHVRIPYLSRDTADRLAAGLSAHAARSTFRW